jgi:hypothetical protein
MCSSVFLIILCLVVLFYQVPCLSYHAMFSCAYFIMLHVFVIMLCFLAWCFCPHAEYHLCVHTLYLDVFICLSYYTLLSCTYFITFHVFFIRLCLVVPILSGYMSLLVCYVSLHDVLSPRKVPFVYPYTVFRCVCLSFLVSTRFCLCYYAMFRCIMLLYMRWRPAVV